MDAVVDVVVLREGAREPQAHRLDGAALAGGAALGRRGGVPALPADARDMGVDLDGAVNCRIQNTNPNIFNSFGLPRRSGSRAISFAAHPTNIGDMSLVLDMHLTVIHV